MKNVCYFCFYSKLECVKNFLVRIPNVKFHEMWFLHCPCGKNELTDGYEEAGSNLLQMNLITVQQDATYSVYYFSTCFGC